MSSQDNRTFAQKIEDARANEAFEKSEERKRKLEEMRKISEIQKSIVNLNYASPDTEINRRIVMNFDDDETTSNNDFEVISAQELLEMDIQIQTPIISRLMPRGTYIFAGAPKVGKSWLVLWLAHQISIGEPIWDFETSKGNVLYLSLEDPVMRLKNRYMEIADNCVGNLHFVTKAQLVGSGLEEQLNNFINKNTKLSLIIIDTLQKIREIGGDKNGYASDYEVISKIKSIADDKNIAFIIVHHTRKMEDNDPFMTISGTNGLLGAADGAFVLVKNKRLSNSGKLYATGRDIEEIKLDLTFDKDSCIWKMLSHDDKNVVTSDNPILCAIDKIVHNMGWSGTSTELLSEILKIYPAVDVKANVLARTLNTNADLLFTKFNVCYSQKREGNQKLMIFTRATPPMLDNNDMCDILDTVGISE